MNNITSGGYNVKLDVDNLKKNVNAKFKRLQARSIKNKNELKGDDAFLMFEMSRIMKDMSTRKKDGKQRSIGPILMVLNMEKGEAYLHLMYVNSFEIIDDNGNKITTEDDPDLNLAAIIKDFVLRIFKDTIDNTTIAVAVSISIDYMSGKIRKKDIPDWVKTEEDFDKFTRLNTKIRPGIMASFQPRHATGSRPKVINIMYTSQVEDGGKNPVYLPDPKMSVAITLSNTTPHGIVAGIKVNTYSGVGKLEHAKKVSNRIFTDIFKECSELEEIPTIVADANDDGIITEIKKDVDKRKN